MNTVAAFYCFTSMTEIDALRVRLRADYAALGLMGTMLIADEGFNGTMVGSAEGITGLESILRELAAGRPLSWKLSQTEQTPFRRLLVKRKREIVSMGIPDLQVAGNTGTYVSPAEWDALIARGDVTVIDTRNDYELAEGTFRGAVNPNLACFRDFPAWAEQNLPADPDQPVAMFCTGGIRCEKATALLRQRGFRHVYHLAGGILAYLEQTGNVNGAWQGTCFIFDGRGTLDAQLAPVVRSY